MCIRDRNRAEDFVAAGNYFWNSGMFLWSARTLANAVREHLPETAPLLEGIAAAYGTPEFEEVFHALYPKCENISVDYAVLEPRSAKGEHLSHLYCCLLYTSHSVEETSESARAVHQTPGE